MATYFYNREIWQNLPYPWLKLSTPVRGQTDTIYFLISGCEKYVTSLTELFLEKCSIWGKKSVTKPG